MRNFLPPRLGWLWWVCGGGCCIVESVFGWVYALGVHLAVCIMHFLFSLVPFPLRFTYYPVLSFTCGPRLAFLKKVTPFGFHVLPAVPPVCAVPASSPLPNGFCVVSLSFSLAFFPLSSVAVAVLFSRGVDIGTKNLAQGEQVFFFFGSFFFSFFFSPSLKKRLRFFFV
ncbi:hypothetical protein DFJ73DRAFT_89986 [Zopfochytrium polystomum]|nr:hypothetical protein DFJ73DRAFT_89986 [Zopfochytrium polystomum]